MTRRILLVPVAITLVLLLGWYLLLFGPEKSKLASARSADAAAVATTSQLGTQLGGLRALQRKLPADAATLGRSLPALPVAVSVDTVIDQIDQAAIATGVTWSNESQSLGTAGAAAGSTAPASSASTATVAPTSSASASAGGLSTFSMSLDISGTYAAVMSFVTQLGQRPRLFVIDSLSFSPSSATVSTTIKGRAFYDATPVPKISLPTTVQ